MPTQAQNQGIAPIVWQKMAADIYTINSIPAKTYCG
jgi:hypothetical protein